MELLTNNPYMILEHSAAIFIFTLIISGNFLAELFPCKIQTMLRENMYVKHTVGFLTLFFFGIVTIPELSNLTGMLNSLLLYLVFLITAKTNYIIWIIIFIMYAIIYLTHIVVKDYTNKIHELKQDTPEKQSLVDKRDWLTRIREILLITIVLLTVFGFIIYIGEKKIEYGNKFEYVHFFTGQPSCRLKSPHNLSLYTMFKAAFK